MDLYANSHKTSNVSTDEKDTNEEGKMHATDTTIDGKVFGNHTLFKSEVTSSQTRDDDNSRSRSPGIIGSISSSNSGSGSSTGSTNGGESDAEKDPEGHDQHTGVVDDDSQKSKDKVPDEEDS